MYGVQNLKPLELTFDWLFGRINQEDVYMKYFGFCELHKKFCNPLRGDSKADCTFYWHNGILFFNDIAKKKAYTCVTIVMDIERLAYNKALEEIYNVFLKGNSISNIIKIQRLKNKVPSDIKCTIQPFTNIDIEYLKSFGITKEFTKKAKWFSIKHYFINGVLMYSYTNNNPCIGYYFKGKWKLYFYKNKDWRFLSNTTKNDIQGLDLLPEKGDLLIITKSFKDIGSLYEYSIPAIAPQAESVLIQEDIILNLKLRFKFIYSLMDYDNTGIHLAWTMKKLYGIKPLFFTEGLWKRKKGYLGAKDFSDYRKLYGYDKTLGLIEKLNIK